MNITTVDQTQLTTKEYLNQEQVELIKRTLCKDATTDELQLFINQCTRTGLDPFSRQIYFTKDRQGKITIGTTIDGFRVVANRHPQYAGQLGPFWCGENGVWTDVWLAKDPPRASKVGVLRHDFKEPLWAIALWHDYAPYYNGKLGYMWEKMGAHMLAKCAETLALRKACPQELSGLYTADEMKQEVEVVDNSPKELINSKVGETSPLVTRDEFKSFQDNYASELGFTREALWMIIQTKYPTITSRNFYDEFTHEMLTEVTKILIATAPKNPVETAVEDEAELVF